MEPKLQVSIVVPVYNEDTMPPQFLDRCLAACAELGRSWELILGSDGFIGSHLSDRLLSTGRYELSAIDLNCRNTSHLLNHPDHRFSEGDIGTHRQRRIYSCIKRRLDCVIWAHGQTDGLQFTLFRPFNWIGPRLDSLDAARIGGSRAITQLVLSLVEGTPMRVIDGGAQERCFTDVSDGIECLFRIIDDETGVTDGRIVNIGSPENEAGTKELATLLLELFEKHPLRAHFPPTAGLRELLLPGRTRQHGPSPVAARASGLCVEDAAFEGRQFVRLGHPAARHALARAGYRRARARTDPRHRAGGARGRSARLGSSRVADEARASAASSSSRTMSTGSSNTSIQPA